MAEALLYLIEPLIFHSAQPHISQQNLLFWVDAAVVGVVAVTPLLWPPRFRFDRAQAPRSLFLREGPRPDPQETSRRACRRCYGVNLPKIQHRAWWCLTVPSSSPLPLACLHRMSNSKDERRGILVAHDRRAGFRFTSVAPALCSRESGERATKHFLLSAVVEFGAEYHMSTSTVE